jgi:outer membrane protein assembly factor BamB
MHSRLWCRLQPAIPKELPVRLLTLALTIAFVSHSTLADNWPYFRGPKRTGISTESKTPLTWAPDKNIKWKAPLPSPGNSSPIVWADKVFLASAESPMGTDRSLYCFNRADGKPLWVKTVRYEKKEPTHETNPYAGSTPAADANRVVVWHGSAGLFCYDHAGNELWKKDLGTFSHIWGYAASPLFVGDIIILNCGPGQRQFVIALNAKTGDKLWQHDEPGGADDKSPETKTWIGSWSSAVPITIEGKTQVLVAMPRRVIAFDPKSGDIAWFVEGTGDLAYTDPLVGDGFGAYFSGYGGPALGFKLGGSGNVTSTNRLWRDTAKNHQRIGSGVIIGPNIYMLNERGIIFCMEATTGKELWQQKFENMGLWGSMVAAGDKIYLTSQGGATLVFAADPKEFRELARNPLRERTNSTPAISDGQIFIRTAGNLWCIEEK